MTLIKFNKTKLITLHFMSSIDDAIAAHSLFVAVKDDDLTDIINGLHSALDGSIKDVVVISRHITNNRLRYVARLLNETYDTATLINDKTHTISCAVEF